jgi:hypothetical protein
VAPLLAKAIKCIHVGESISRLFDMIGEPRAPLRRMPRRGKRE